MTLALLASLALASTDPCAPVEPAPTADPAAAAEYRSVAEAEQAAGERETAVVAWRKAARLDPTDTGARDALARLCREGGATSGAAHDAIAEAIRLLDAGRYREAATRLREARRIAPSTDAALVEGICRYELGEGVESARLLRIAEADPRHRDTARLYLGLVVLREGSAREAASLFDAAGVNPAVAPFASELASSARWEAPLLISLRAEGGYDSNVSLTSTGAIGPANTGDAVAGLGALAIARPFGANGLFLRVAGAAEEYARLGDYDFTLIEGAAGVRAWRGNTGFTAEYAATDRTLGGRRFLTTQRLLATGSVGSGPFALAASAQGRWDAYASGWSGYSGLTLRADGRASVALGPAVRLGFGWTWAHDDADAPTLAWAENGPRADVRLVLGPGSRILAEVGRVVRRYEQYDAALAVRQRDEIVDGLAAWELDLRPGTTLRLSVLFRHSSSNVAGFEYTKVVPAAGIGVVLTP